MLCSGKRKGLSTKAMRTQMVGSGCFMPVYRKGTQKLHNKKKLLDSVCYYVTNSRNTCYIQELSKENACYIKMRRRSLGPDMRARIS